MGAASSPHGTEVRLIVTPEMVADRAGVSREVAAATIDAHLFAVVALAAGGVPIVLGAGSLRGPSDCPFSAALLKLLHSELPQLGDGDFIEYALATLLPAVPEPRYPPVYEDQLGLLDAQLTAHLLPEVDQGDVDRVVEAWCDLTGDASVDGRLDEALLRRSWEQDEAGFETWVAHECPTILGIPFEVVHRQWRTPAGTIADLVCRATADGDDLSTGDIIIIENKAVRARPADVDQLLGYIEHANTEGLADGHGLFGLLAAPGIGYSADLHAIETDINTVTWAELGYSDYIWHGHNRSRPIHDFLSPAPRES